MKNLKMKSHVNNLVNLFLIPSVTIASFYFVANQINTSLNHPPIVAEVKFETLQLSSQPAAKQPIQDTKLRERRVASYYSHNTGAMNLGGTTNYSRADQQTNETYQEIGPGVIIKVSKEPISTFSLDVDTGGFANIRRMINSGKLPAKEQVRTEEIINYFSYDYPQPYSVDTPFSITTETMQTPWNQNTHLLSIGIHGYSQKIASLPASNLVFLVDVSGSMQAPNKLPLVKESLHILTDNLRPEDSISIVTYANDTHVLLPSVAGSDTLLIKDAISKLHAGGGTAGESGMRLAYKEAKENFITKGNNRIIMMTDGDFNVGMSSVSEMTSFVEKQRESGIYLSTVGFGSSNYREDMMEQIANHGNGVFFYIDSIKEATRVFERNLRSNLFTIANDVKIQVEFNPESVSEYRLIGYENRKLAKEDFTNDDVDAGEVGQGHSMTALYEIRYGSQTVRNNPKPLASVRLRYKTEVGMPSQLIEHIIHKTDSTKTSNNILLAASAAGFGEILRESSYISDEFDLIEINSLLNRISSDPFNELTEFRDLILNTASLMHD